MDAENGKLKLQTFYECVAAAVGASGLTLDNRYSRIVQALTDYQADAGLARTPVAMDAAAPTPLKIDVRWMFERGVEGDLFHPHLANAECGPRGCVEAGPIENWEIGADGAWRLRGTAG